MFCENCGYELTDDVRFCPNCGKEIMLIEDIDAETNSEAEGKEIEKILFSKKTWLGIFLYKHVQTEVKIGGDYINLHQNIERFPMGDVSKTAKIRISDINMIHTSLKMDIWNTLLAIISIIKGFSSPFLFIVALILISMAYGRVIKIYMNDGEEYRIPYKDESEQVKMLITIV